MNVVIRKAALSDLPLLMEYRMRVLHEVFSNKNHVDWDFLKAQNEKYYQKHLTDNTHTACFALNEEDEAVGCGGICYQTEMPSPDNADGSCGYLMNIFTVPEMRGRGIGKKIAEYLIDDARRRNTGKIYLESSVVAKRFYEEIGFRPMHDYYRFL